MEEAYDLGDRIAILSKGKIVGYGKPEQLEKVFGEFTLAGRIKKFRILCILLSINSLILILRVLQGLAII
jgi:ABC-type multidrug transport system ATPase subunit